jgi:hypothetical protein
MPLLIILSPVGNINWASTQRRTENVVIPHLHHHNTLYLHKQVYITSIHILYISAYLKIVITSKDDDTTMN